MLALPSGDKRHRSSFKHHWITFQKHLCCLHQFSGNGVNEFPKSNSRCIIDAQGAPRANPKNLMFLQYRERGRWAARSNSLWNAKIVHALAASQQLGDPTRLPTASGPRLVWLTGISIFLKDHRISPYGRDFRSGSDEFAKPSLQLIPVLL
jgi:hypothetical protein